MTDLTRESLAALITWAEVVRHNCAILRQEPPWASSEELQRMIQAAKAEAAVQEPTGRPDLVSLAAEILQFEHGCEKPHRSGERNPHVHLEVTHRWGQRLAAIARERAAQPAPDPLRTSECLGGKHFWNCEHWWA